MTIIVIWYFEQLYNVSCYSCKGCLFNMSRHSHILGIFAYNDAYLSLIETRIVSSSVLILAFTVCHLWHIVLIAVLCLYNFTFFVCYFRIKLCFYSLSVPICFVSWTNFTIYSILLWCSMVTQIDKSNNRIFLLILLLNSAIHDSIYSSSIIIIEKYHL